MQGRVVLVTGAARGIGKEVVRQLADLGASVLVSARKVDDACAAAKDLSAIGDVRALEVDLDVADDTSVQAAAKALWRDPGRLDVLVNNAAAYVDWSETASSADLAAAHRVLEVNLFGPWRLTNALLPLLRRSDRPRIVNVSSGAGSHGDEQFGLTATWPGAEAMGARPVAEGAASVLWGATLTDAGPSGELRRDGQLLPW